MKCYDSVSENSTFICGGPWHLSVLTISVYTRQKVTCNVGAVQNRQYWARDGPIICNSIRQCHRIIWENIAFQGSIAYHSSRILAASWGLSFPTFPTIPHVPALTQSRFVGMRWLQQGPNQSHSINKLCYSEMGYNPLSRRRDLQIFLDCDNQSWLSLLFSEQASQFSLPVNWQDCKYMAMSQIIHYIHASSSLCVVCLFCSQTKPK